MNSLEDEDVEILGAVPSQLKANCVVPQSIDDQWVPRDLLQRQIAEGKSLREVADLRGPLVRREYIRVLLTARQVVVNRTYLYRNPIIFGDYIGPERDREAFEQLLANRVIVPFLLEEHSPLAAADAGDPRFARAAGVWDSICRRLRLYCVRLSWDDTENSDLIDGLMFRRFAEGVRSALRVDAEQLLFGLGPGYSPQIDDLRAQLADLPLVRRATSTPSVLDRTFLYSKFVTVDGTPVWEGRYDPQKRHVASIKAFIDVLYNMNLARALGRALVTPADTPHHSLVPRELDSPSMAVTLLESVQNSLFGLDLGSRALESFETMTLADVVAVRSGQLWQEYSQSVDELLAKPWLASHPRRGLPYLFQQLSRLFNFVVDEYPGRT